MSCSSGRGTEAWRRSGICLQGWGQMDAELSAALEVCQEGASSGVTLRSFQGDPSPEQLCLSRSSVNPDQSCLTAAQPAVQTQGLWCASCHCHICKGLGASGALCVLSALGSHHRPLSTHFTVKGTSSKGDPALLGISAD